MTINHFSHDKEGREYFFAAPESAADYTNLVNLKISAEDLQCELQLDAIGPWEALNFHLDSNTWLNDQKNLVDLWRPFQPKEGILNDRDSILLYGMPGDTPTSPAGLAQYKKKLGYKPKESDLCYPTEAANLLTCCNEVFNYFSPLGRSFLIRLNAGGFYPRHRDHLLLNRDTFRLIIFLGDSQDSMEWEVAGQIKQFLSNTVYYVDTRKVHRLASWSPNSTMVVINVRKNWLNVLKVLSRLKHS
jgi:hypothetical protein